MENVNSSNTRSSFFPRSKNIKESNVKKSLSSKSRENINEGGDLKKTLGKDVDVFISDRVKNFSKIIKIINDAPELDNTNKIARLKRQIEKGEYVINYEALADKILQSEL